jgi:hypothetical protein
MRVPFFIIKGKAPLNEILKELGINLKEETESTIYISRDLLHPVQYQGMKVGF